MQIRRVEASYLANVPITPPPFLKEPSRASIVVTERDGDFKVLAHAPIAFSVKKKKKK